MIGRLAVGGRKRGFTLIELMVVVAIVALVSAAIVPSFSLSLQRNRQREAAMLIIGAVFGARSQAARTGRCHRVRVYTRTPGSAGGEGGIVAVDRADTSECSRAAVWTRVGYKSVAVSIDPDGGDSHAGLIGNDIAIARVLDQDGQQLADPEAGFLRFEPSGGLWLAQANERFYEIQAYTNKDRPTGIARHVRVSPSGSVKYVVLSDYQ